MVLSVLDFDFFFFYLDHAISRLFCLEARDIFVKFLAFLHSAIHLDGGPRPLLRFSCTEPFFPMTAWRCCLRESQPLCCASLIYLLPWMESQASQAVSQQSSFSYFPSRGVYNTHERFLCRILLVDCIRGYLLYT